MGADTFTRVAFGKTADEAFSNARKEAEEWHGSRPYTGSIKEKDSFTKIPEREYKGKDRRKFAGELIAEGDDRIDSKWGPAGAVSLKGTQEASQYRENNNLKGKHGAVWLFFGWAPC
ncbi:hypothetical protein ACFQDD_06980 [Halorubrum pallidum]|uniref:Uncharacterized protein n=1 Tax=Halorubrum pallidum TaxID=1526114 RepID=A0ABD5T523_9EURY